MLDVAAPVPDELDRAGLTPRQEVARQRVLARRDRLSHLWENGAGHSGDHSAWEAYNAVVESVDHDEEVWRVRGSRAEALLDGRLVEIKDRVLGALVAAARGGS